MNKLFIFILYLFFTNSFGQNEDSLSVDIQKFKISNELTYSYKKPTTWQIFKYVPSDLAALGKFTVQKENLKWDAMILGLTIAIIPYDQKILEDAGQVGEKLGGWDKDAQFHKLFNTFRFVPKNIPSAVYNIGNGGTTIFLSGLFYGIGKIGKDDYRALNTSSELMEVLFSVGVTTQTIKRITGRQSPSAAISDVIPGGDWNVFPSFKAYQSQTPNYDAMPSGHLATYLATLTVISTNYPEIRWIKPVGYSLGGVLAFSMVSGKVHWTSDYPIAILAGYVIGKTAANRRIIKESTDLKVSEYKTKYKFDYTFNRVNNFTLAGATLTF